MLQFHWASRPLSEESGHSGLIPMACDPESTWCKGLFSDILLERQGQRLLFFQTLLLSDDFKMVILFFQYLKMLPIFQNLSHQYIGGNNILSHSCSHTFNCIKYIHIFYNYWGFFVLKYVVSLFYKGATWYLFVLELICYTVVSWHSKKKGK